MVFWLKKLKKVWFNDEQTTKLTYFKYDFLMNIELIYIQSDSMIRQNMHEKLYKHWSAGYTCYKMNVL